MSGIDTVRRQYAAMLAKTARLRSWRLIDALARVPREAHLGPPPWTMIRVPGGKHETSNPRDLYGDLLVIIEAERLLNNGQPSVVASLIDALDVEPGDRVVHVGAGTGYYTALIADIVGASGRVTAIEIDPELADRAREALTERPWVAVITADGFRHDPGEVETILVNAGVTHPAPVWLDRLASGARLVLPMTTTAAELTRGEVFRIVRTAAGFEARFTAPIGIFPCIGGREPAAELLLADAFAAGGSEHVRSLRRDAHEHESGCWLHGDGYCLSRRTP